MSPDPDEQFTFHYEILHGFRASSSTHSGHFGVFSASFGGLMVAERDRRVNKKIILSGYAEKPVPGFSSAEKFPFLLVVEFRCKSQGK